GRMDPIYLLFTVPLSCPPTGSCGPLAVSERHHDRDLLACRAAGAVSVRLPAVRTATRGAVLMDANTMFGVLLTVVVGVVLLCVKPGGNYMAAAWRSGGAQ